MTNLSPAALAVMDAYANASDGEYVEGVWVVNERTMLAAALRAAASAMRDMYEDCNGMSVLHDPEEFLENIAAELYGTNRTSENDYDHD